MGNISITKPLITYHGACDEIFQAVSLFLWGGTWEQGFLIAKLIADLLHSFHSISGHHAKASSPLSVVKAWVGEIPSAPYVSTETIAHGTMSCDCG